MKNPIMLAQRSFSLLLAGIDFWILYSLREYEYKLYPGPSRFTHPRAFFIVCTTGAIAMVIALIWFGDELAEFEHYRQRWCSSSLVKFVGWAFLLIPIAIFILNKII